MTRSAGRLVGAALATLAVAGCGASAKPQPKNGLIAAYRDALYLMNGDGSGLRRVPGRRLGPAVWTPDGKWLAFNTHHPIVGKRVGWTRLDLWLTRPDETGRHLVAKNVPLGAISPDGKTMAFMNDACAPAFTEECELAHDNASELYLIGLDGRGRRRLTHNRRYDGDPSWSPDGKRFVYTSDDNVRVMDVDRLKSRSLGVGSYDSFPQWSPHGDQILLRTQGGWATVALDGGDVRYLKRGPRGPDWFATWSPDGKRIAYLFRRARTWTAHDPLQIWVMNADGSGRHPITKTFGWGTPSWAPDSEE